LVANSGRDLPADEVLRSLWGRHLNAARRLVYVVRQQQSSEGGGIEMTFDGAPLLFDVAADGDSLAIRPGPWRDPFEPPLSPENAAFVEEAGKWTAVDIEQDHLVADLLGAEVVTALPLARPDGRTYGATIAFENGTLIRIEAEWDELTVKIVRPGSKGFGRGKGAQVR
jgi:hypothetical protein